MPSRLISWLALHSKLMYIPSSLLETLKIEHEYVVLEPGSVVIAAGDVLHQGMSIVSLPCVHLALTELPVGQEQAWEMVNQRRFSDVGPSPARAGGGRGW